MDQFREQKNITPAIGTGFVIYSSEGIPTFAYNSIISPRTTTPSLFSISTNELPYLSLSRRNWRRSAPSKHDRREGSPYAHARSVDPAREFSYRLAQSAVALFARSEVWKEVELKVCGVSEKKIGEARCRSTGRERASRGQSSRAARRRCALSRRRERSGRIPRSPRDRKRASRVWKTRV